MAARSPGAAERLAGSLRRAGVPAAARPLLEALSEGSSLLLIDSDGHEEACRRALENVESRERPPPAVLLTSDDPAAFLRVGGAFGFVPKPLRVTDLAPLLAETRRAWRRCSDRWSPPCDRIGEADVLHRVAELLEEHTGSAVRPDRRASFLRALRARMAAALRPTPREYLALLSSGRGPQEGEALACAMAVGETYFWRYAGQYAAVASMLPEFPRAGAGGSRVRIWSAGCSTGEEAYSLAIACLDAGGASEGLEVVATDLRHDALLAARDGVYPDRRLRNLPAHLRGKYFEPVSGGGRVVSGVRAVVRFEPLNLGGADLVPWAGRNGPFHAVFCRNTLLYLSPGKAARAVQAFERSLVPGGALFLGASETLGAGRDELEVVRAMGSFFYRKRRAPPSAAREALASAPPPGGPPGPPAEAEALYRQGVSALGQESFEEAALAFEALLRVSPADGRGHVGLAFILAGQGRDAEASVRLRQADEAASNLPETPYLAGLLAERGGDDPQALANYAEALNRDPGFFMAHVNRAWILRRQGRVARFRGEVEAALAILGTRPAVPSWITGGLGADAVSALLAEALNGDEAA